MTSREFAVSEITPEVLLRAYACGIFPMAESADDPGLYWIEPERRGVIPLDGLNVSQRLARTVRSNRFEIVVDRDFEAVIDACAAPAIGRRTTWINRRIRKLYRDLFAIGHCHSVEVWQKDELVGGLYGVELRPAPSSARACFIAPATPRRWRWCIWWRACRRRLRAARHAICDRASDAASARSKISRRRYRTRPTGRLRASPRIS